MKKAGLTVSILFLAQFAFASFPQSITVASTQSFFFLTQSAISPTGYSIYKDSKQFTRTQLSFPQKIRFKLLKQWLEKGKPKAGKSDWIASIGGFLLGLCLGPIGYGITRLTNNKPLRKGAVHGFKVFLIIIAAYLALLLFVLLLFLSLGLM